MTKEELEKEAEFETKGWKEQKNCIQAYLAGAEPREKKIKELKEEIQYLIMGKNSLQNLGWPEAIQLFANKEKHIANLEKENAKLKGEADSVFDNWCRGDDPCPHLKKREEQLTNAKEIIKKMSYEYQRLCLIKKETITEAEQFIK